MRIHTALACCLGLVLAAADTSAQVVYPPKPEKYDVRLRYRIRAGQDERIRTYREMTGRLARLGFVETPREDADLEIFDPFEEFKTGTIPSANAARILEDPNIHQLLLFPAGFETPEDATKPIQVRISIPTGLQQKEQLERHVQTVRHLQLLGFRENPSYDHVSYSLIRGTIPAGRLPELLKDLRRVPGGWFAPAIPMDQLPTPFRNSLPIRTVEVLPDAAAGEVPPKAGEGNKAEEKVPVKRGMSKLSADARAALAAATGGKPLRLELILDAPAGMVWEDLREKIRSGSERLSVEGRFGNTVTVWIPKPADVEKLAAIEEVQTIRAPRAASETAFIVPPEFAATPPKIADLLTETRLVDLHKLGYGGEKVRVVVVASEFPGLEGAIGKELPADTKFIDLTAELSPAVLPMPARKEREEAAAGIHAARMIHAAAPAAQLYLVRIDPAAMHQLATIARTVTGDKTYSEALQARSTEMKLRSTFLEVRRNAVTDEYRKAYMNLNDDEKDVKRREAARAELAKQDVEEEEFKKTVDRFAKLKNTLDDLKGSGVVVNTLVWDTGFPLDGISDFARMLDDKYSPIPFRSSLQAAKVRPTPVWVQAASMSRGRIWTGPWRDADGNGIMEFAASETKLPEKRWTRELDFLGFSASPFSDAKPNPVLPAGLRLRITVQWREPREVDSWESREPLIPFSLKLFRQIDPEGKTVGSDEMTEVARTEGEPVRLQQTQGSGAFEVIMETTLPVEGIYALRLDAAVSGNRLPGSRQNLEVQPRIVIEPIDLATTAKGSVVFLTYANNHAGVGMPADAAASVTAGFRGKDGDFGTLTGTGPGVQLRAKPDFLTLGTLVMDGKTIQGSAISAGFVGGTAASLLSGGARANDLVRPTAQDKIGPLVIPEDLLRVLSPRAKK